MPNSATPKRYIESTRRGLGPLVSVATDLPKKIWCREGAFSVEYGVQGEELRRCLLKGAEKFVRDMELQGLSLVEMPDNPTVVGFEDGTPMPTFSLFKTLERSELAPDEAIDAKTWGKGPETLSAPNSLDESYGLVDYRIVGVFWAPQVSIEIMKDRRVILAEEKAAKKQTIWMPGQTTPKEASVYK